MKSIFQGSVLATILLCLISCGGGSGGGNKEYQSSISNSSAALSSLTVSSSAISLSIESSSNVSSSSSSDVSSQRFASSESSATVVVSNIAIVQTGVLLTHASATKQLSAKVTDAAGNPLNVPVVWSTSRTNEISVDTTGKVTALVDNGSAQIIAEAGGVQSASLLVVVTQPATGAVLINDSNIVGEPVETTPDAEPAFTNTYEIGLSDIAVPAVGSLLINTESKMVAGRVIAVDSSVSPAKVTLGLVSIREMFPNLNINEVIDLANAPITFPDEITSNYNVTRTGDIVEFTPKNIAANKPGRLQKSAAKKVGPFECERFAFGEDDTDAPLEIEIAAPPTFSISLKPSLDMLYTSANGMERFLVRAEPTIKVDVGVSVASAFEGKVECKAELYTIRLPVGGPLALVVGGVVPVGVGFEAGGKLAIAEMEFGVQMDASAEARAGISCPDGLDCKFDRGIENFTSKITPKMELPSLTGVRLEPTFAAFGYMEAALGNPFLKSIRFDMLELKAGAKLEGNFGSLFDQVSDDGYKSDYKAALEAGADVGKQLGRALELMGVSNVTDEGFAIETEIARSPIAQTLTADKAEFNAGDQVNFTVKMDTQSASFFPGLYNIKKIQLVRKVGTQASVVAEQEAGGDNNRFVFTFAYDATDSGKADEFSVFVVTTLLPFNVFALELGTVASTPEEVIGNGMIRVTHHETFIDSYQLGPLTVCCDAPSGGNGAQSSTIDHDTTFYLQSDDSEGVSWTVLRAPGSMSFSYSYTMNKRNVFREDMSMRVYRLFGTDRGTEKKGCTVTETESKISSGSGSYNANQGWPILLTMTPNGYQIALETRYFEQAFQGSSSRVVTREVSACDVIQPEIFTENNVETAAAISYPVFRGTIDPESPNILRGSQTIVYEGATYIATWEFQLPRKEE